MAAFSLIGNSLSFLYANEAIPFLSKKHSDIIRDSFTHIFISNITGYSCPIFFCSHYCHPAESFSE